MKKILILAALSLSMLIGITRAASPPWSQTNWPAGNSYFSLTASQDKVFARTWDSLNGGRVFLTTDEGLNWTQISSADTDIDILSIVILDSSILAGTWGGLYLSSDGGATWNAVTPAGMPADIAIWSLAMLDTTLFAGTTGGIYKSQDNGDTWTEVDSGIPLDARITSIVAGEEALYAGSAGSGVFKTTNGGASWTVINSGLADGHISQLLVLEARIFAVTLKGVFISDNNGTNWTADNSSLGLVNCLVVVNNQLFAGTDDNGVYFSGDRGATWTPVTSGMPADTRVWSLASDSEDLYAGTSSGVWRFPIIIQDIPLLTGWNLVSFRAQPPSTDIEDVLADIAGNYDLVYAWDATGAHSGSGNWMRYAPGIPVGNTLATLEETQGFWIRMTAADTLEIVGTLPATDISLLTASGGWNLVGYPHPDSHSLPDAFSEHGVPATDFNLVYAYQAGDTSDPWDPWKRYAPDVPVGNDLAELTPGLGYWILVNTEHDWTVP